MAIKYKVDNVDLYRQYARFASDYVQNIRENDKGFYSDGVSYAATIKVDVFEDEHTYDILKDFTEIFVNRNITETSCYYDCGMFDVEIILSHNYEDLGEVLDSIDSALVECDFKIKDCYGHLFHYSSLFNVGIKK